MTGAPDVEAFLATLERLPPYAGLVFRGCDALSHERWGGRAVVTRGLLSTSRDPRVATENFTAEAVYAVVSRTGRSIEPFSAARHEREVVFLPGTVFTMVTRARVEDLPVTIVEQFDPSDTSPVGVDLDEVSLGVARAVLAARAREAVVPEPVAGKFVGDIG